MGRALPWCRRAFLLFAATAPATSAAQDIWHRDSPSPGSLAPLPDLTTTWSSWLRAGPGKAAALRGNSDLVPPRDTSPARFSRYDELISNATDTWNVPAALLRAVIRTESDFDPRVVSSVGARGLMQLMPATARELGVADAFDPAANIAGGARYLHRLAQRFCQTSTTAAATFGPLPCSAADLVRVIAAYHAGAGAVEKYGGLPPYETTRFYVTTVLRRFGEYGQVTGVSR
jgi:soluble lytic murein transglycosylase-like protein